MGVNDNQCKCFTRKNIKLVCPNAKNPANNAHARELASSAVFEIDLACERYKAIE